MTTPFDVIRAAIPGASDELCDYIMWARTPFPFKKLTAREIYKAASGTNRAAKKGINLCDHCDRIADYDKWECKCCHRGRTQAVEECYGTT